MSKPRLLIVDDSVVIRRALTAALSGDPNLEVVGSASEGGMALIKIPLLRPDVVALDIEMPGMTGLETLASIRRTYPQLPVIMLNVGTPRGAAAAVDALIRGASDYVVKPEAAVPGEDALKVLGADLASKVALCCAPLARSRQSRGLTPDGSSANAGVARRIDVVTIGVSTGGPRALMELIPAFPADFPIPILVVQHMLPTFTKLLAERLAANARIPVAEGIHHQPLAAGCVWIAPGDVHMAVERHGDAVRLVTHRAAQENSCRPSADVLFESVAHVYGPHALAVVMTGMGKDGFRGCEQIHAAGGHVLVQDAATSVVWGMPGFVARSGMADQIVPLSRLGIEIIDRVCRNRQSQRVPV